MIAGFGEQVKEDKDLEQGLSVYIENVGWAGASKGKA